MNNTCKSLKYCRIAFLLHILYWIVTAFYITIKTIYTINIHNTKYFIFIFLYLDVSDGNSSLIFFKLFPVKNLHLTMEFFNYSDQEFLEIPTEFRLEKQLAYLHSFVASLHPIWFGHEGDVLIISHQLVPLMLKCFIYSSTT